MQTQDFRLVLTFTPRHHLTAPEPTSHPQGHPAPPSPAEPNQGHPNVNVDAQDPGNLPSPPPPDPEHPPPSHRPPSATPTPASDPPTQGPEHSPGLVPPTRELDQAHRQSPSGPDPPGNGLHETIVDLVLWRACQHAKGQHVWIPPVRWGQALTHGTDTNVTRGGTIRLQRAPAENDHPADPNHPEQWEQATAPTRNTGLRAAGLRTPDNDLPPPPTDSDQPPPEIWLQSWSAGTTT